MVHKVPHLPQFAAVVAPNPAASATPEKPASGAQAERKGGLFSLVEFMGKFHVVVVHFPIALLLCAALAELLFLRTLPLHIRPGSTRNKLLHI